MLVEVVPIVLWSRITGAFSMEGAYYLVTWLMLLGARESDLGWLPLLFAGATVAHAGLVIGRRNRHGRLAEPRRTCLIDTGVGRGLWLLAYLWAGACYLLDWGAFLAVSGCLAFIVAGQAVIMAGASAWTTWIKAIVPERQRGPFFAWRNVAGFVAITLVLGALTQPGLWPGEASTDDYRFWFYFSLFTTVCVISLLMLWPLAWAPPIPAEHDLRHKRSAALRHAIRRKPAFWRYATWNTINVAASLSSLTWLQPLLTECGVTEDTFAWWDARARVPAVLVGITLAGALIHRIGAVWSITLVNLILVVALGTFSAMPWMGADWLPLAMVCDGLGRGALGVALLSRLHEVIPHGDARFPALFMGLGGAGALVVSAIELPLLPLVSEWHAAGGAVSAAWCAVAAAAVLRLFATPLVLDCKRRHA